MLTKTNNLKEANINSQEFQDAMKIYFDSIINIFDCQKIFDKYDIETQNYAIFVIQKSLQIE